MFQLRPVLANHVFALPTVTLARLHGSLWIELFQLVELTEIMRQRDDQPFAELLNRARYCELTKDDKQILKSREVEVNSAVYRKNSVS